MSFAIQGPTLANPEALHTVEELRRELHRANELLFSQFFQLAQADDAVTQMVGLINDVLLAHLKSDAPAIGQLLNAYLGARERLREKLEERIESDRMHTTSH